MSFDSQHLLLQVHTIPVSVTPSPHPPSFPSSPYSTTSLTENSGRFSGKNTHFRLFEGSSSKVRTLLMTVLLYQAQIFWQFRFLLYTKFWQYFGTQRFLLCTNFWQFHFVTVMEKNFMCTKKILVSRRFHDRCPPFISHDRRNTPN